MPSNPESRGTFPFAWGLVADNEERNDVRQEETPGSNGGAPRR